MSLSSVGTYLPTIDSFQSHWESVEARLGRPITLRSGLTRTGLVALRGQVATSIAAVTTAFTAYTVEVGKKDIARGEVAPLVAVFNRAVRGALTGSGYEHNLPDALSPLSAQADLLQTLAVVEARWTQINGATIPGFTGPLTLPGGLTLAQFVAQRSALQAAFLALEKAETTLSVARKERDTVLKVVKTTLVEYRRRIAGLFAKDDPITTSLPAVNPEPGSTPPAVSVSGVWDATNEAAQLTILPLTDPKVHVAHYEVRHCPGTTYKTAQEETIGRFADGATVFETTVGLAAVGAVALFRVYVVTETGNEKGSTTIKITRR